MKYIISGTNRPNSRTLEVAKIVQGLYENLGERVEIIDLQNVPMTGLNGSPFAESQPHELAEAVRKTTNAEGLIVICPEYNGSMPGILKYFIDHWSYPDSYEFRPICLIGLGGRFGGLRPVEHLQQIFGYRNAYIYPVRVFLTDVWHILKDGKIQDERLLSMLKTQAEGFSKFVKALSAAQLDANSLIRMKAASVSAPAD